jgi:hypothetical protein
MFLILLDPGLRRDDGMTGCELIRASLDRLPLWKDFDCQIPQWMVYNAGFFHVPISGRERRCLKMA